MVSILKFIYLLAISVSPQAVSVYVNGLKYNSQSTTKEASFQDTEVKALTKYKIQWESRASNKAPRETI